MVSLFSMCSTICEMTSKAIWFPKPAGVRTVGKLDCVRVEGVRGVIMAVECGGGTLNVKSYCSGSPLDPSTKAGAKVLSVYSEKKIPRYLLV